MTKRLAAVLTVLLLAGLTGCAGDLSVEECREQQYAVENAGGIYEEGSDELREFNHWRADRYGELVSRCSHYLTPREIDWYGFLIETLRQ